ncbi:MAG: hypothetical protein HUK02_09530 [Bacteroidaceae bacterium]|nr:hypothetical protein [Bacteroidaceae bacterium]
MKKLMTLLVAVLLAGAANAQAPEKGLSWAVEAGLGSQFEIGGRAQYNFNKYVAWDVLSLKYGHEWDCGVGDLSLKTGVRGFSPEFGPKLKAFAALDFGYTGIHGGGEWLSCFGMDFTMGLYVWKGLYLGYGLETYHKNGTGKDHFFRIGYNF